MKYISITLFSGWANGHRPEQHIFKHHPVRDCKVPASYWRGKPEAEKIQGKSLLNTVKFAKQEII